MERWRLQLAVRSAALLVFVLIGCASAGQPSSLDALAKPFAIRIPTGAGASTTLGGKSAPFVYWTPTGVEHRLTVAIRTVARGSTTTYRVGTDERGRTAVVSVHAIGTRTVVHYAVSGASRIAFAETANPRAHFLGTGQRTRWVDMSRTVQPLKVRNACGSSSPSPFFVSTAGFGTWVASPAVGRIGFPDAVDDTSFACDLGSPPCSVGAPSAAVRWCFSTDHVDATIATGTISEQVTAHARAAGLPRTPWLPQFALIKWRDAVRGPSELFDDVQQLRSRDIPIGWVLLDNPWEKGATAAGCYGSLTFGAGFPDPKQMIARLHGAGVRFMLWISPQLDRTGACSPPNYPDGWLTGDDKTFVRDLTEPAERNDFIRLLKQLVALGVDGFKGDRGDEVNLEPNRLAGGPGALEQNAYPLLYDRAAAAALSAFHGPNFASLFRSFVPGSSNALPGFVGPDAEQSFTGLSGEIRAAQTSGVAGVPVWGSDVGGYASGTLTPGLFVRWAQFAALTPIFEVGGAGPNAMFWTLGPAAVSGLRSAATLHYELVPYLYSLAQLAHTTGLPVVRPLGLTWPNDNAAWKHGLEFTVGGALLAAPVTADGGRSTVYLPSGAWVDLFTGARVEGGRTTTRTNGPSDFPLYLRAGHAVPDNFRSAELWSTPWRTNDLLRDARQGWLVATDNRAPVRSIASQGARLTAETDAAGHTDIVIKHALREEQVAVQTEAKTCSITLGASPLRRVGAQSIRGLPNAWMHWRGGIVVKISNARATTRIRLTAC